jgi:hypothetical protein
MMWLRLFHVLMMTWQAILLFPAFTAAAGQKTLADGGQATVTENGREHRIEELKKQRDRIRQELSRLQDRPEGVGYSTVPRSELMDQPTRTMRVPLESVPGTAVRQGAGARDATLSIRGSGK